MKILIIDDARFQRGQVMRMLKELGHTVVEATNGEEGLARLAEEAPEVVFCDLLMPVMDGRHFLVELQARQVTTPVIMLSADIQTTTKEQCALLGAKAFVNKPCTREDLAEALKVLEGDKSPA